MQRGDLDGLVALLTVAEKRSFTAAAAVLGDAGMGPPLPRLAVISAVSLYAAACSLSLVLSAGRGEESR